MPVPSLFMQGNSWTPEPLPLRKNPLRDLKSNTLKLVKSSCCRRMRVQRHGIMRSLDMAREMNVAIAQALASRTALHSF